VSTTDNRSLELLVALLRQAAEDAKDAPEQTTDPARRTAGWIALAAFGVALVPIILIAVAIAPRLPSTGHTPALAGATFTGPPTSAPRPVAVPPPLPPAALARSRTEIAALAARLPANVTLTAPAAWTRRTPADAAPAGSCPQIFGWLANRLGGSWTYVAGALPEGSCAWAPRPDALRQPTPDRFVVEIGFQRGDPASLLHRPPLCVSGAAAPRLAVPGVTRGAVLVGCDDGVLPSVELRVPDAGGSGVWFLRSASGANQHTYTPSDGVLAALDGASHAYG